MSTPPTLPVLLTLPVTTKEVHTLYSYLRSLRDIYDLGTAKVPHRAELSGPISVRSYGLPNLTFSAHLMHGFPLLTARRVHFHSLVGELRAFLKGATTVDEFRAEGCNYWDAWGDEHGNLGPIYGAQWLKNEQLDSVLQKLRCTPEDRRMVVSAWNPSELDQMALPPCHYAFNVVTYGEYLHLNWSQRSADWPIGVPYDIALYALLCELLAKWAGLKAGRILGMFGDCHIYETQMDGVAEMLRSNEKLPPLPTVEVWFADPADFTSFEVRLCDYNPLPHGGFGPLVVK